MRHTNACGGRSSQEKINFFLLSVLSTLLCLVVTLGGSINMTWGEGLFDGWKTKLIKEVINQKMGFVMVFGLVREGKKGLDYKEEKWDVKMVSRGGGATALLPKKWGGFCHCWRWVENNVNLQGEVVFRGRKFGWLKVFLFIYVATRHCNDL